MYASGSTDAIYIYIYVCMYIYMYVCIHIWMCVYIYTYLYKYVCITLWSTDTFPLLSWLFPLHVSIFRLYSLHIPLYSFTFPLCFAYPLDIPLIFLKIPCTFPCSSFILLYVPFTCPLYSHYIPLYVAVLVLHLVVLELQPLQGCELAKALQQDGQLVVLELQPLQTTELIWIGRPVCSLRRCLSDDGSIWRSYIDSLKAFKSIT